MIEGIERTTLTCKVYETAQEIDAGEKVEESVIDFVEAGYEKDDSVKIELRGKKDYLVAIGAPLLDWEGTILSPIRGHGSSMAACPGTVY